MLIIPVTGLQKLIDEGQGYCEIKEQRRLFASADFYCEILTVGIYTKTGFYSSVEIKGHRPSGT